MDESGLTPSQKVRLQFAKSQAIAAKLSAENAEKFDKAIKPVWYQDGNVVKQLGQGAIANGEVLTNLQYLDGTPMMPRPTGQGKLRADNRSFIKPEIQSTPVAPPPPPPPIVDALAIALSFEISIFDPSGDIIAQGGFGSDFGKIYSPNLELIRITAENEIRQPFFLDPDYGRGEIVVIDSTSWKYVFDFTEIVISGIEIRPSWEASSNALSVEFFEEFSDPNFVVFGDCYAATTPDALGLQSSFSFSFTKGVETVYRFAPLYPEREEPDTESTSYRFESNYLEILVDYGVSH